MMTKENHINISNRIDSIDITRGICILAVLIGHVLQGKKGMQIFYSFHMPLMFIISGYFINTNKDNKEFIKSRISRILIPYCICCGLLTIGKAIIAGFKGNDIIINFIKWLYISICGMGGGYWYSIY